MCPLRLLAQTLGPRARLFERVAGLLFPHQLRLVELRAAARTVMRVESGSAKQLGGLALDQPGRRLSPGPARRTRPSGADRSSCSGRGMASAFTWSRVHALVRKAGFSGRVGDRPVPLRRHDDRSARYHRQPCPRGLRVSVRARCRGPRRPGRHEYILAGSSCLAGDVLGVYAFDRRLRASARGSC